MTTLQIDDDLAATLSRLAEQEHTSPAQLLHKLLADYTGNKGQCQAKQPELLTDFAGILADSPSFRGGPLDIQKAMRDEWD